MSHPSRSRRRVPARWRREHRIELVQVLEDRCMPAPFIPIAPDQVTFTPSTNPTNANLGVVTVQQFPPGSALPTGVSTFATAAATTSVSELTSSESFGNDIVRIVAGPGGVFGDGIYAISRGAGDNASQGALNKPGVIYRVDPATGKTSVFFDLNTVIKQTDATATNGAGNNDNAAATGLLNWYDIAFDPEGYFDGTPSMFVSSVDSADPAKNIIYQIGPTGNFMGAFVDFTLQNAALSDFAVHPSAILVPPVQQQSFLRGLLAGGGASSTDQTTFNALFFDSNQYTPGQNLSTTNLPAGVNETQLGSTQNVPVQFTTTTTAGGTIVNTVPTNIFTGPLLGMTASNITYASPAYGVFTDFGTPAGGGIPATPGYSGVQGLNGESLIAPSNFSSTNNPITSPPPNVPIDQQAVATTPYRRFDDIAFDQYGYFEQGFTLAAATAGTTGTSSFGATVNGDTIGVPQNVGAVFVADLASGDQVSVTPQAPLTTAAYQVPVQGNGTIGVQSDGRGGVTPILVNGNSTGTTNQTISEGGNNAGGRILRITPNGVVSVFAEGFATSSAQTANSLANSSLSISFSADGTILYAADDQGIWQFKTVTDLADSQSGQILGLNDLRSLGVPYDGQGSAVAIVDTGVDANTTAFQGRVAAGTNVVTNGLGNIDTAPGASGSTTTAAKPAAATGAGGQTPTVTTAIGVDGHGTLVAGVVAQFVPQATIVPVDIFSPFQSAASFAPQTASTTGGTGGAATTSVQITATPNAITSSQYVWDGMNYVATHPYVNDPVRPGKTDRIVTTVFGFGSTETFASEGTAYQRYPQIVVSLKNRLHLFRKLGITPVAAAGQFGAPYAAGVSTASSTTGTAATTTTTASTTSINNNSQDARIGDNNGMALPAILNESVSVTGSYPFPYTEGPNSPPIDQNSGVIGPNTPGPILIYSTNTIGGTGGSPSVTGSGAAAAAAATGTGTGNLSLLTAGDFVIYANRLLASANRNSTTDFAAPAVDVPTFSRSVPTTATTTTTTTTTATTQNPNDQNVFNEGGTSLSAGIVGGAFTMVASALDYWQKLRPTGYTADAYLTMPVGVNSLNFGKNAIKNLSAYATPDGINSILQWTSVPTPDTNNGLSATTPPALIGTAATPRNYSEINVSNAIAAIEGSIAINYLLAHNDFQKMDTNHNGLITAQEIQNFVDNASTTGQAEAGAMAALLGGTARSIGQADSSGINGQGYTAAGEQPDQPDVLQRRFNFFDYAADGQLNGSISLAQFRMLAHTLLPSPDAFTIVDRQRASASGYLLAPAAQRDYTNLQHLLPSFEWVPKSVVKKYVYESPNNLTVDKAIPPGINFPVYTLFAPAAQQVVSSTQSNTAAASNSSTASTGSTTSQSPGTPATAGTLTTSASTTSSTTPASTTSSTTTTTPSTPASTTSSTTTTTPSTPASTTSSTTTTTPSTPASTTSSTTTTTPSTPESNAALVQAFLDSLNLGGSGSSTTPTTTTTSSSPTTSSTSASTTPSSSTQGTTNTTNNQNGTSSSN